MKKHLAITLAALAGLALVSGLAIAASQRADVKIAVWQSTEDPSRIHLSTRVEGGKWETELLALTETGSGRYLRSEIVGIDAPEPAPYRPSSVGATATARMMGADGSDMGTVTIEQGPWSLVIRARLQGLTEGGHGFHIHETGSCEPDFGAAGSHLNLGGHSHGELEGEGTHTGDLPNLFAGADGVGRADVFTDAATLDAHAPHTLFDADGSAIVIHAGPDDYRDVASAGARVACGVITLDQ